MQNVHVAVLGQMESIVRSVVVGELLKELSGTSSLKKS